MKKVLKRLPVLLAVVFTVFAASCSDIEVEPVGTEDDDDPIIISPPKPKSTTTTSIDSVSVG
jgi:hypothetical protein